MRNNDPLQYRIELSAEEQESAALLWEALAHQEETRLKWDATCLHAMVRNKAALYRKTAADIRAKV